MQNATVHNFADDNTFSNFAKTFYRLKEILEFESECEMEWFTKHGMLANPGIFKPFIIDKKEQTTQMKRHKLAHIQVQIYKIYK